MVFGVFPLRPDPDQRFHKQIAMHDWYFGDPDADDALRPAQARRRAADDDAAEGARARAPAARHRRRCWARSPSSSPGCLCIAEDQPRSDERRERGLGRARQVRSAATRDRPQLYQSATSRRSTRWRAARAQCSRSMGAVMSYTHRVKTFSHAVGTVRMGIDARDLAARRALSLSRRRQSVGHRRQRAADVGRRQSEPDDRGQCAARRRRDASRS